MSYARVKIEAEEKDIAHSAPTHNFSALGIFKLADGWETSVGAYRVGAMYWLGDGDITKAFTRIDARLARRWKAAGISWNWPWSARTWRHALRGVSQ